MSNFEQSLSICVIISRVALITVSSKHCTVFGSSKFEQGRETLSSLEGEPRHRNCEGMQILSQLPAGVLWECALHPFGKIGLMSPGQQFRLLGVFLL